MYAEGEVCPVCECGRLESSTGEEAFVYKGGEKILDVSGYRCNRCGEILMDDGERRRIEKVLTDFRRETDGLLRSDEIKRIRLKFGKSQVEFAKLLGLGEKNFARYETGQTTQSRAIDDLLRILDEFPMAIGVLEKRNRASHVLSYRERITISESVVEFPINCRQSRDSGEWEDIFQDASSF